MIGIEVMHPWVARYQDRLGVAVQVFPLPNDPQPTHALIEAGLLAEAVGLDGFYIGDHPGYAPEPFLHLAAIAGQTSKIELGSMVFCVCYRHPMMLARLAADLDQLSDGRLVLGLGIGWNAEEFQQLGQNMQTIGYRQRALDETVAILNGAWTHEPFTFAGEIFRAVSSPTAPGPRQLPRPPIVIAGGGEKVTLRQVARYADGCNFGPGSNTGKVHGPAQVLAKYEVLREHCESIGRSYDHVLRTHFTSWLMIGETEREAIAKRDRYYPDGLTGERQITRIVGSPDQIVAYYSALVEAGVQYFVMQILDARDQETIRLLGAEVAPRLRNHRSAAGS